MVYLFLYDVVLCIPWINQVQSPSWTGFLYLAAISW
eukprot:Gb_23026 [translate_table: standard]